MDKKVLVTWFSRADENYAVGNVEVGNTAMLGQKIITALAEQGITASDFSIVPERQYPLDYQSCIAQATAEQKSSARPAYLGEVADFDQYSLIFFGYPIWWGDLPMVVYNFLEKHDFSDKTVAPFCTHEGSGDAGTFAKLPTILPSATILPGLACTGSKARTDEAQADVTAWLKSLPLK